MTDDPAGFEEWLLDELLLQPTSAALYVRDVRIALAVPGGVVAFLKNGGEGRAPKTLRHYLAALRAWAQFKGDGKLTQQLGRRMARLLPEATVQTPKHPLSRATWQAYRKAVEASDTISDPMRGVILFMALRGVRVGDVLRLERRVARDALTQPSFFLTTKRKKRLEIETALVRPCLAAFLAASGWTHVDQLIAADSAPEAQRAHAALKVYRAMKRVAIEADLDPDLIHPHQLRRTVASLFLEEVNGDLEALMRWMGWSSYQVALGYVQYRDRRQSQAAAKRLMTDA